MVNYRYATLEDLNTLVELRLQYLNAKTSDSNFFSIFQNTRNYFEEALKNETCQVIFACDEAKVIGVGMIYYYNAMPTLMNVGGLTGYITNLFVQLNYRRNGIGHMMIQFLMNESVKKNVKMVITNPSESCHNIFSRAGFVKLDNSMVYQG